MYERTVRNHKLLAGLVEANDESDLDALDVITLSHAFYMDRRMLQAVQRAVRRGARLLTCHCVGQYNLPQEEELLQALFLAKKPIGSYHTPGRDCGQPRLAVAQPSHPTMPGLAIGSTMQVWGCGNVYEPQPTASVHITQAEPVIANSAKHTHQLPAMPLPVMPIGTLGQGRVMVINTSQIEYWPDRHPGIPRTFKHDLIAWLAKPRKTAAD